MKHFRCVRVLIVIVVLVLLGMSIGMRGAQADGPIVKTNNLAGWVEGNVPVTPAKGTPGRGNSYYWEWYFLPGQTTTKASPGKITGAPYYLAYANQNQPVQSTDWWAGVGMQWQGWVKGNDAGNPVIRTSAFFSEPFYYDFIDLPDQLLVPGLDLPVQGLRMWNQADIHVYADDPNPLQNLFGRGDLTGQRSPIVTVGLAQVHPIANYPAPVTPPWTNVKIQSYSDWGVVMSYADNGSELTMTMANGSPFTWLQRTSGDAPFRVWTGGDFDDASEGGTPGTLDVWYNQNGVLGVTVNNYYNPPGGGNPPRTLSSAAYAIYADAGTWTEQKSTGPNTHISLFKNDAATKVVVAALPHNVDLNDQTALENALTEFENYAWQRVVDTQLQYPPIGGAAENGGLTCDSKPLGYDAANSVLRSVLAVTTEDFKNGGAGGSALQVVFPHHRLEMPADDKLHILTDNDEPKYTWRSLKGELQAFAGNCFVQELTAHGILPNLPSVALQSTAPVNGNVPVTDIYNALKTWFYKGERNTSAGKRLTPFSSDIGNWMVSQNNTYAPNLAGVYETILIADQLIQSPGLTGTDADLNMSKKAVVRAIRSYALDSLKELVGRWADIYTSGYFQYNPDFDTMYGFPQGYGSVQNLNDKHFHWGYFLKSAAVIGRHDPAWLNAYMPLFQQLVKDVANYQRNQKRFPFLRNFNPYYGHNWADGIANGGLGDNQESTGEATNFAAGMFELGELTGDTNMRDVALYLYEQEIMATQQYWFNQDADLENSSGTFYNGNWPDAFVHYQLDGQPHTSPVIDAVFQSYISRAPFYGASPPLSNLPAPLLIQATPLSASNLYVGRNEKWLEQAWLEFQREYTIDSGQTAYEIILAGIQARLSGTGTNLNDPGPFGALTRINTVHPTYEAAMNTQGKYWAYTLHALGQVDTSVVADTPSYGVFCNGGSGANCAGGTRSFVAYNPTANAITVNFTQLSPAQNVASFNVPAGATATVVGNGAPLVDTIPAPQKSPKLYLTKPDTYSTSCRAIVNKPLALSPTPGNWKPTSGNSAYPTDTSALAGSIVCVPKIPTIDIVSGTMPDSKYVRTWQGKFSGTLLKSPNQQHSQFAIYTNHSLFPGWQQDPCVQGGPLIPPGCPAYPPGSPPPSGNVVDFQISYDFDSNGKPDRVEAYVNAPLFFANAFTYANKQTDYHFGYGFWPIPTNQKIVITGSSFPTTVTNGTVQLDMWGGGGQGFAGGLDALFPVPVSVNADPLTNRASWVMPPYR